MKFPCLLLRSKLGGLFTDLGINRNEAFFVKFLFKLISGESFIMADSGTSMSSSSSKDARQQETFERSVDQDTPAQGVYLYIYMQFIYLLHYLLRSKLISTQELAYTPRHIC